MQTLKSLVFGILVLFFWVNNVALAQPDKIDRLINQLQDNNAYTRRRAIRALSKTPDPRAVEPLIAQFTKDGGRGLHGEVVRALVAIGSPAVGPLIDALKDEDHRLRQNSATALGYIGDRRAVEPLIEALKDENWQVRISSVGALAKLGDSRAVEPLITALKDESGWVRPAAATALGYIGDHRAKEPLIAALKDESQRVRSSAATALSKLGDHRAIKPLIVLLKDGNLQIRSSSATALGRLGDPRAVEPLIDALKDENWQVRISSVNALGKLRDPRAVEPLITLLKDPTWNARMEVVEALVDIGYSPLEALILLLKDENQQVRRNAVYTLGKIADPRTVEPLIGALKDESSLVRKAAAEALDKLGWKPKNKREEASYLIGKQDWDGCVKIGAPAVEPLIGALRDKDSLIRKAAVEALDRLKWKPKGKNEKVLYLIGKEDWDGCVKIGAPAVEALITLLQTEEWHIRREVVITLGKIADLRAVEPLINLLEKDKNRHMYNKVIEALGEIGDPRAVEPLIILLKDKDRHLRRDSAKALGKLGDPRAVEPLILLLKDKDQNLRSNSVIALGKIADPRAVEPLIGVLKDKDSLVRKAAVEALDKLGWKPQNKREEAFYLIGKQDWDGCVKIGAPAVEPLILLLKGGEDRHIYNEIVKTLGEIGDRRAVEPLLNLLEKVESNKEIVVALGDIGDPRAVEPLILLLAEGPSWGNRKETIIALGKIGDSRAVKPLVVALRNKAYRKEKMEALDKLGAPAVELLIALLKDEDPYVRWGTVISLAEIGDQRAVEPLIEALKDEELPVRYQVAYALDKLDWKPKDGREEVLYLIGKWDWDGCRKIGAPAVEPLIALLNDKVWYIRKEVIITLGKIADPHAAEPLIALLEKDGDWYLRYEAARALGKIGDRSVIEPLIAALKDENSLVRKGVAEALDKLDWKAKGEYEKVLYFIGKQNWDECVKIGAPAVEPLVALLWDKNLYIRKEVAETLEELEWQAKDEHEEALHFIGKWDWNGCRKMGGAAVEPLLVVLSDRTPYMRKEAAEILGEIGDLRAVEPLINLLADEDILVRREAARALGRISDPRGIKPLITALKDKDSQVQKNATEALDRLEWKSKNENGKILYLVGRQDWVECVEIGAPTVESFITLLIDEDRRVRMKSADLLGKIGDPRAVEPLILLLKDEDIGVRISVARALGKIGDRRAIEPLIAALSDKDRNLQRTVKKALKEIKAKSK
jgi:HEAT repeat protein